MIGAPRDCSHHAIDCVIAIVHAQDEYIRLLLRDRAVVRDRAFREMAQIARAIAANKGDATSALADALDEGRSTSL